MAPEISSDMPGAEAFDGMSEEELGEQLPNQGAAGSEGGDDKGSPAQGQEGKVQAAAAAGQLDPNPSDQVAELKTKLSILENTISNMNRESGAYRALQSKVAKLENALQQRSATSQGPLSPEQQAQEAQRQEAEKFLRDFLRTELETNYGHIIGPIQRQQFVSSVQERCTAMGMEFEELNPIFGKIINSDIALAKSGDEEAVGRLDRIMKEGDSTELMLRAVLERSKALQAQGAQVQQRQQVAASKGGRAVKPNGAKPSDGGKRTLADVENMSEEDREKMSLEELEALIPKQGRR